jgi:hypothetical protein
MLIDTAVDKRAAMVSHRQLQSIIQHSCVAVAGFRINALLKCNDIEEFWEDIMIELKLCISLLFKPLLHHLRRIIEMGDNFTMLWASILNVMEQLLSDESDQEATTTSSDRSVNVVPHSMTKSNLLLTTKELATEHLRNFIMVLMTYGVLDVDDTKKSDTNLLISEVTWEALGNMTFCSEAVEEWKRSGLEGRRKKLELENGTQQTTEASKKMEVENSTQQTTEASAVTVTANEENEDGFIAADVVEG